MYNCTTVWYMEHNIRNIHINEFKVQITENVVLKSSKSSSYSALSTVAFYYWYQVQSSVGLCGLFYGTIEPGSTPVLSLIIDLFDSSQLQEKKQTTAAA